MKEQSPSRDEILRRVAEAEQALAKKETELRALRRELTGIAAAVRTEWAAPRERKESDKLDWEAVATDPRSPPSSPAVPAIPAASSPANVPGPPPVTPPPVEAPRPPLEPVARMPERAPVPPAAAPPPKPSALPAEPEMDLETRIGAVWFNRIGMAALVIGFALFARYFHERLHPWHKVAGGYGASLALFLVGWLLEARLKLFARPVMAGGLAIAFFTSFAGHFLEPMRCIPLVASIVLMSLSIVAIFACAERWKSEATAGFAIFLGHVAAYVAGGDADTFSLVAILFLGASGVLLFLRHDWAPLSLFAVIAAYASHFLWAIQEHPVSTPRIQFWANFSFFTSYFVIFLAADTAFRHRAWKNPERYTRAQRASARALGPVSLVLYSTFAAGIFHVTKLYWPVIHYWLFPLAAVEALLVLYHRRKASPDAPFHAAAATVLATLGLFSAMGGLSLNLALAAEALMLLLMARRLGLWFLPPLAQAVLGVNFVHYWLSDARMNGNWPAFLGSAATALVYFTKSRLEETWPAASADHIFSDGRLGAAVRRLFQLLAPLLACVHAALGGVLLSYACSAFFGAPWDAAVLGGFAVAVGAIALFLASGPLLFASCALEAGCAVLFVGHIALEQLISDRAIVAAVTPRTMWSVDQLVVAALSVVACCALARAPRSNRRAGTIGSLLAMALLAPLIWISASIGQPLPWLVVVWGVGPGAFWVATEAWRARGRWIFAVAAAALTARAAFIAFPDDAPAIWFLSSAGLAILCAASWRDSGSLLSGTLSLFAITASLADAGLVQGRLPPTSSSAWAAMAAPMLAASALQAAARWKRRGAFVVASLVSLGIGAGTFTLFDATSSLTYSPLSIWLLNAAAFWLVSEPLVKTFGRKARDLAEWRDRRTVDAMREAATLVGTLISIAGAAVLVRMTARHFSSDQPGAIAGAECTYALVFLLAAFVLRSPGLAGAYAFSLSAAHVVFFTMIIVPDGSKAAFEHAKLSVFLTISALAAGVATESFHSRRRNDWTPEPRGWVASGAWYAYALGLLLGCWFFGERAPRPETGASAAAITARAVFPFACFVLGWLAQLRWLRFASHGAAFIAATTLAAECVRAMGGLEHVLPAASLIAAVLLAMERMTEKRTEASASDPPLDALRIASVLIAAALLLLTLELSLELEGDWTTFGWSLVAFALAGLGFLWKDRIYRRTGLAVFGASLVRAIVVDVQKLELFHRMLAFLCLGVCLLLVSFLYSKFRDDVKKWL